MRHTDTPEDALDWLIESETEAIEALQQAIAPTGREGRSEALEHLLPEHRRRRQLQVLRARALGKEPDAAGFERVTWAMVELGRHP